MDGLFVAEEWDLYHDRAGSTGTAVERFFLQPAAIREFVTASLPAWPCESRCL
jgi:hypothetical protein